MTHKDTATLETERLTLHLLELVDAEVIHRIANEPEVILFTSDEEHISFDEVTEWCRRGVVADGISWAVCLGEMIIGYFFIYSTDDKAKAMEVSCGLSKAYWHNGYAAEALRAVTKFAFEELKINRLWATHDPRNSASGAVLRKSGMSHEATMRQCKIFRGELVDRVQYAILAEDYFSAKANSSDNL